MKIHKSSNTQGQAGEREDKGFTLIEILIAIVLIGILSAVAVVGISSLVSKGGTSACTATKDAAIAGSAVYFASNNNTYPTDLFQLTSGANPAMTMPSGVTNNADPATPIAAGDKVAKSGSAWTLTMATPAGISPTFTCS